MNGAETRAELIDPRIQAAGWGVAPAGLTRREVVTHGRASHDVFARVLPSPEQAPSNASSSFRASRCVPATSRTRPAAMSRALASKASVNALGADRLIWSSMRSVILAIWYRHAITSTDRFEPLHSAAGRGKRAAEDIADDLPTDRNDKRNPQHVARRETNRWRSWPFCDTEHR